MRLFLAFILSFLTAFGPVVALAAATRTTQTQQGDGGGTIERNYIQNSNAIANTAGWVTYADGAAYVDGTGGVPTATWTRSTSSPIGGDANFVFTPGTLGDGVSYTIALDSKKKGMWIPISFDYQFTGTTPSDGDVQVMVYDITNSQLIQPAPYKVPALVAGVNNTFVTGFQASSSSTSYRVSLYQSTSTSTYTMKGVNFRAGGTRPILGAAMSDWVAYTPTITGFGTATSISFYSRRMGDTLQVRGAFLAGTTTVTNATFTLGYNGVNANVITDSSKASAGAYNLLAGHAALNASSTTYFTMEVLQSSTNQNFLNLGVQTSTLSATQIATANQIGSSAIVELFAQVPIVGWSSNLILGSDADTRLVAMEAGLTSAVTPGTNAVLKYDTVVQDTHSCYSVTTGLCTIPVGGTYRISITCLATAATTNLYLVVSGVAKGVITTCDAGVSRGGSISYPFTAGQTVGIFQETSTAMTATSGSLSFFNRVSIEKVSGPSTIAASETVSLAYTNTSAQSMGNGATTTITGWTKDFDSHNAFVAATGIFTCPSSGKYMACGFTNYSPAGTPTTGAQWSLIASKNSGGQTKSLGTVATQTSGSTSAMAPSGCAAFNLVGGDTLQFQAFQNSNATQTLGTSTHAEIYKIAN